MEFGTTKTSAFSSNAQSRFESIVFYGALRLPRLALLVSLYFREQRTRQVEGPLKSPVPAQKAIQGFETKTREFVGATTENSVSLQGVIDLPSMQIDDFLSGSPNI